VQRHDEVANGFAAVNFLARLDGCPNDILREVLSESPRCTSLSRYAFTVRVVASRDIAFDLLELPAFGHLMSWQFPDSAVHHGALRLKYPPVADAFRDDRCRRIPELASRA